MGYELGKSRSPGGRIGGIPKEVGSPSAERDICVESPAGAETQSARKNLPAWEVCFAQARLPGLWP